MLVDDVTMRVARSAFVAMLAVAVAAVVAVPAPAAVPSVGNGVIGDRLVGESVKDLDDSMVTRQGASGDPSMSTVTGADGLGCWWEPQDDGSTETTCGELTLHPVAV